MASSPSMPPPPGAGDSAPQAPTSPAAVSPSPASPSPTMDATTKLAINIVSLLRALAKANPGAAPGVAKINDIMQQEVMPGLMKQASPGEPQAPPGA